MATLDNIHINYSVIDGYNKDNNLIIAPRHDGKTTCFMVQKAYKAFVDSGAVTCVVFRNTADMTAFALQSYIAPINKFKGLNLELRFSNAERTDGICPCYLGDKLFLIGVSLSVPERRLKGLVVPNCRLLMFDEVIINVRKGERYLKDEFNKMKTLLDTLRKEGRVRAYFLGNPYSLTSPYSTGFGIPTQKAKLNDILVGESWAFWRKALSPELKQWLIENDATFREKDEYASWALDGIPVNDEGRNIGEREGNYSLDFAFVYDGRTYGVFRTLDYEGGNDSYYIDYYKDNSKRRYMYTFRFEDMVNNTILASKEDKRKFSYLKKAIRNNDVRFRDINACNVTMELYPYL